MGNVFDQKETYDWAVSGDLIGFAALPAAAAPAPPAAAPEVELLPLLLLPLGEAAWATIELAAERALAKFGRDPPGEGAKTAAKGEEAAADIKFEAKLEADEDDKPEAGRVCM